jgi:hypothetical protein
MATNEIGPDIIPGRFSCLESAAYGMEKLLPLLHGPYPTLFQVCSRQLQELLARPAEHPLEE